MLADEMELSGIPGILPLLQLPQEVAYPRATAAATTGAGGSTPQHGGRTAPPGLRVNSYSRMVRSVRLFNRGGLQGLLDRLHDRLLAKLLPPENQPISTAPSTPPPDEPDYSKRDPGKQGQGQGQGGSVDSDPPLCPPSPPHTEGS